MLLGTPNDVHVNNVRKQTDTLTKHCPIAIYSKFPQNADDGEEIAG